MKDFDNVDDLFKDLDANEFHFFSRALASYRRSLLKEGFTRREAMRLVEAYSRFIYNMSIEEFIRQRDDEIDKNIEEISNDDQEDDDFDDNVDDEDDDMLL